MKLEAEGRGRRQQRQDEKVQGEGSRQSNSADLHLMTVDTSDGLCTPVAFIFSLSILPFSFVYTLSVACCAARCAASASGSLSIYTPCVDSGFGKMLMFIHLSALFGFLCSQLAVQSLALIVLQPFIQCICVCGVTGRAFPKGTGLFFSIRQK